MKKNAWIIAMLVAVAALAVVAVKQNRQLTNLKEQSALIVTQTIKAPTSAPPPPARLAPPATVPDHPAKVAAPPQETQEPQPGGTNFFANIARMMKDPQFKDVVRLQQKMQLDKMYSALWKHLNLSPEQQEAFNNLLLDRLTEMTRAGLEMMSGGDPAKAGLEAKAIKDQYDEKIKQMLGDQNYPVFQQYEEMQPERVQADMFKTSLTGPNALTEQQEESLIAAWYDERKALPPSALVNNPTPDPSQFTQDQIDQAMKYMQQVQERYLNRAATLLTAPQYEQFKKFQEQWLMMQSAGIKMAQQMFGNKTMPAPQQ